MGVPDGGPVPRPSRWLAELGRGDAGPDEDLPLGSCRSRSTSPLASLVRELRISASTVREHLGGVFEKFAVGSPELVAVLLGGGH